MDRRHHRRFDLQIGLSFQWVDTWCVVHREQGVVRDVSGGGVFVCTTNLPRLGTDVQIELHVGSVLARSPLVVQGVGEVVRVQQDLQNHKKEGAGFAAAVRSLVLRDENGEVIE
jgi:hypothetical protein